MALDFVTSSCSCEVTRQTTERGLSIASIARPPYHGATTILTLMFAVLPV